MSAVARAVFVFAGGSKLFAIRARASWLRTAQGHGWAGECRLLLYGVWVRQSPSQRVFCLA